MKNLSSLCVFLLLIACSPKPASEADSVKAEPETPTITEPKDTVAAEPVVTQTAPTETPKPKQEDRPKPLLCKYQKLEGSDCLFFVFDCGSFGAEAISLPNDQADVWNNLMAFSDDHGDAPVANPQYVGKTFAVFQKEMDRDVCVNGAMVKQKAKTVTSFKLSK